MKAFIQSYWKLFISVVLFISGVSGLLYWFVVRQPEERAGHFALSSRFSEYALKNEPTPSPSPTPEPITNDDPFKDLTIPYLRSRDYTSEFTQIRPFSEDAAFTTAYATYLSDTLHINGLLTQPKGDMPEGGWPAVVFVHGYIPPQEYRTEENYTAYMKSLADDGIVIFKIDLRGHDVSEGDPTGAYFSSGYVIDTLNAVEALKTLPHVNPDRIGLWGHSMAGNVTFRAFVAAQDIPALVIWAGAGYSYDDFATYRVQDNSYQPPADDSPVRQYRNELNETHGSYSPESEFWQMVVPTNYLEEVTGSVQVHHAVDDSVVNIGYSRDLMSILDATSISHELKEYPSGGHNITGASYTQAMEESAQFFKEKL